MAISIPASELRFSFVRSSGPGGQNVNKVNSKAVLRWDVAGSPSLAPETRARLLEKLRTRLNDAGELVLMSDEYRDQIRNREACLEKLHALVAQAMHRPKARKKTKPSRSTKTKNRESKRRHAEKKRNRRGYE